MTPRSVMVRPIDELDREDAFGLLAQLYPELTREQWISRLDRMQLEHGYELIGAFESARVIGVAGFIRLVNLVYGAYVWVHDLVVDQRHRARGVGTTLMRTIHELAAKEGRDYVALAAHVSDVEAHRFYERHLGYERRGFVFRATAGPVY